MIERNGFPNWEGLNGRRVDAASIPERLAEDVLANQISTSPCISGLGPRIVVNRPRMPCPRWRWCKAIGILFICNVRLKFFSQFEISRGGEYWAWKKCEWGVTIGLTLNMFICYFFLMHWFFIQIFQTYNFFKFWNKTNVSEGSNIQYLIFNILKW